MIKIAKYEFNSREQAEAKIKSLGVDEEGVSNHNHTVVKLGNIAIQKAKYDEKGVEVSAAVLSDKFHVDVLWADIDSHPYGWATYAITLDNEGSHSFFGVTYLENKL